MRCLAEKVFSYLHYSDSFRCVKAQGHTGEHVYGVLGAAMRKEKC